MVSEKQIDTVARMLDPDAFTLEKTMLLMKGEMFGHHGERVRAARGKAEELLTAAEQAEPAPALLDGDEQAIYTDPYGKVWHPHRGYWCWKVSHELAQARKRIKELEAEPAPAARSGAVKVKPLEWEDFGERASKAPAFALCNYFILHTSDGFTLELSVPGYSTSDGLERYHPTLSAAKAAAQADYERRILAALEPAPTAEPVAWRYETTSEHIARDIRAGRFPARSEKQKVPIPPAANHTPSEARLREALEMMLKEHDILSGNYDVACPVTGVMPPRNPDRWPTAAEAARRALEGSK